MSVTPIPDPSLSGGGENEGHPHPPTLEQGETPPHSAAPSPLPGEEEKDAASAEAAVETDAAGEEYYPDDRVLVGVVNRKRDFLAARDGGWYRIPMWRMPRGIHAEVLALFVSRSLGRSIDAPRGAIDYYARIRGVELARRRDLLPKEKDHPRAEEPYYRLALDPLIAKVPPIRNTRREIITFVYTTWDRLEAARTIRDLYSTDARFVDRYDVTAFDWQRQPAEARASWLKRDELF